MGARRVSEIALIALATIAAGSLAAASHATDPPARATQADFEQAARTPADADALNRLLAGLPKRTFDDRGTPRLFYVWEGDMILDADEVQSMIFAHRARQAPARPGELLLQVRADGQPGVWPRNKRTLTYSVDCASFPSAAHCTRTKEGMRIAERSWQSACTNCGVVFRFINAPSGTIPTDSPAGPSFVVRYDPTAFDYVAISFFANDPAYKRYLDIAPGYFTTNFSRPGILRHELGHVLGYRHEHLRALGGCFFETGRWTPLTPYDPHSVMHYFCGGGGTMQLQLTSSDVSGHRSAYR